MKTIFVKPRTVCTKFNYFNVPNSLCGFHIFSFKKLKKKKERKKKNRKKKRKNGKG